MSGAAARHASTDKSDRIRPATVLIQDAREYNEGAAFYGFARRRRAQPEGHVASGRHTRPIGIGSDGCGPRAHPSRSAKTWGQHNYTRAIRSAQNGNSDRTFPKCEPRRDPHRRRRATAGPNWSSFRKDGSKPTRRQAGRRTQWHSDGALEGYSSYPCIPPAAAIYSHRSIYTLIGGGGNNPRAVEVHGCGEQNVQIHSSRPQRRRN
jgi:hypothetical protein